jgi:predicted AAA+ superfamily ATPase
MLLYLVYPSTVNEPPIIADHKKSPRLQFIDTGLLNYSAGLQDYFFKFDNLHSFYQGTLAEHIVGQEIMSLEVNVPKKISFWVREQKQANSEVDFIFPFQQYAIPLEVKAGKAGSLRSLHQYIDRAPHPFAVRLYAGPINESKIKTSSGKEFKLLDLPYFLAGKIGDYIQRLCS